MGFIPCVPSLDDLLNQGKYPMSNMTLSLHDNGTFWNDMLLRQVTRVNPMR